MMIKCQDDDYDRDDGDSDGNNIDNVEEEEDENTHRCRFIQDRKVTTSHLPTPKDTVILESRVLHLAPWTEAYVLLLLRTHTYAHTQTKNLYTF